MKDGAGFEWKVFKEKIDGLVNEGNSAHHHLAPATTKAILKSPIERDAVGGAVIYDGNGKLLGHVEVAWTKAENIENYPYALYWNDELLCARCE